MFWDNFNHPPHTLENVVRFMNQGWRPREPNAGRHANATSTWSVRSRLQCRATSGAQVSKHSFQLFYLVCSLHLFLFFKCVSITPTLDSSVCRTNPEVSTVHDWPPWSKEHQAVLASLHFIGWVAVSPMFEKPWSLWQPHGFAWS